VANEPSSGGKKWDLGKEAPKPAPKEPPPAPSKPDVPKPPRLPKEAIPSVPRPAAEESGPAAGGSPLPTKLNDPRQTSLLGHPLTLIGVGFAFCICLVWFVFIRDSPPDLPTSAPPVSSNITPGADGADLQAVVSEVASANPVGDVAAEEAGRLLLASGQILAAAADFLPQTPEDALPDASGYAFVPPALERAELPPEGTPEYYKAFDRLNEAKWSSIELGRGAVAKLSTGNFYAPDVREVALRVQAEGLALLDRSLKGPARGQFPEAEGAAERLADATFLMSDRDVDGRLRFAFEGRYAESLVAARARLRQP